jgi:hypothetical protein
LRDQAIYKQTSIASRRSAERKVAQVRGAAGTPIYLKEKKRIGGHL